MSIVDIAAQALRDLARLAVPVECPGCGARDVRWCESCAAIWWDPPLRCESLAPRLDIQGREPLPVWAPTRLSGPAHGFVAAWKDSGRRDLDSFMSAAMRRAAAAVVPSLDGVPGPLGVIAVASRPGAVRRRGADLPARLALAAADGLGERARVARDVLRVGRGEQRGGSARERWRSMVGGVSLKRAPPPYAVVLVDDVMTTGASLASASALLERAGTPVVGAIVLAVVEASGFSAETALG